MPLPDLEFQRRRVLYFVAVVAFGFVVHQGVLADLFGLGPMKFFRRQSEAYAIMFGVPLYWELFARHAHPGDRGPLVARQPRSSAPQLAFFGALIALSFVLAFAMAIPNSVVTLKEALVAVFGISAYLGWSRGFLPSSTAWGRGAPIRSQVLRLCYYILVVGIIIVSYKPSVHAALGESRGNWLQENSEAFGALLAIPLYFDVAARYRNRLVNVAWYGLLIAIPVMVQINGMPEFAHSFVGWLQQMTEAFIAAIAISFYFDVVVERPVDRPEHEPVGAEPVGVSG